jgi:hypothetical protein
MRSSVECRDDALDAIAPLYDNGYQRVYDGTQPAALGALSGNTLLAELRWGNPAFGASSGGVLTANALTADASANNSGTATFVRNFKADGTTVLSDMSIGTSGAEVIVPTTTVTATQPFTVSSATITFPIGS